VSTKSSYKSTLNDTSENVTAALKNRVGAADPKIYGAVKSCKHLCTV
jgi:hypothetical protein